MVRMTSQDLQQSLSRKSQKRLWLWQKGKRVVGEEFQETEELLEATPEEFKILQKPHQRN